MSANDLQQRLDEKIREVERLEVENERLRALLALSQGSKTTIAAAHAKPHPRSDGQSAPVDAGSLASEKVAMVSSLFRGRQDVYALRVGERSKR